MLKTPCGNLSLPVFLPDGTIGVVRSVDSQDLENSGVGGIVVSTFHLLVNRVNKNLHELMGFKGPILTDSGGFQVFSLLRDNPKSGRVTKDGFKFDWNGERINFTPEQSIKLQVKLGSDILICLDQCTDPGESFRFQKRAVETTINWAQRCKKEFAKVTGKGIKPLLFAVIQGGNYQELRKYCAEELIKIGFDGYCYGGWPIDGSRKFLDEIVEYTARLMPDDLPKYALGVGKPEDIIKCVKWGYSIFDCVIPTREARHRRLYIWKNSKGLEYETINLNTKLTNSKEPMSKFCDCHTCKNYTRAYLCHLFKIGDTLAYRLATIHNLRFYTELMDKTAVYRPQSG